ncbi:hypothetical protein MFIFM68171_09755 [Madurella fahalii]|uniref:Uncharacterized protein n=1 Tax=Madurella fahalii TaxID=1157608 RepID=A0ABQ0GP90_9PEZI
MAASTGSVDVARVLLAAGANLAVKDNVGRTPLHAAVIADRAQAASLLLEHDTHPGIVDNDGLTPLALVCKLGRCVGFVEHAVLNFDENLLNWKDQNYDESPIHWACEFGQYKMVSIMLAAEKVDPNQRASRYRGYTPLHLAIRRPGNSVVALMLDSPRVDPSVTDENGLTPLELAINDATRETTMAETSSQRYVLLESLLKSFPDNILPTADLDDINHRLQPPLEADEAILRAWARRVQQPAEWRSTRRPLHTLVRCGDRDRIRALVDLGANASELDEDGWTFLDIAGRNGYSELLKNFFYFEVHILDLPNGEYFGVGFSQSLDAFVHHKFQTGKIYPIVGFSADHHEERLAIHFRVVFRESAEHPFLYKGPYT